MKLELVTTQDDDLKLSVVNISYFLSKNVTIFIYLRQNMNDNDEES